MPIVAHDPDYSWRELLWHCPNCRCDAWFDESDLPKMQILWQIAEGIAHPAAIKTVCPSCKREVTFTAFTQSGGNHVTHRR